MEKKRRSIGKFKAPTGADVATAVIRFAARAAVWAVALVLINLASPYTGVSLSVGVCSVSTCALLGVPGLGLLLCASAMF